MQCRDASAGGPRDAGPARALVTAAVLLSVLLAAAACTQESATPPATVPSTVAPLAAKAAEQTETVPTLFFPPGFVPADTRGVKLPQLVTTDFVQPPIPVFGGKAHVGGTVFGPDGPVEGGVVRLERFVNGRGGFADVPTGKGGRWDAVDVYGGHYRVRAWLRPNLATTEPQVGFVADVPDSNVELSIGVEKHDAKRLQAALDNGGPRIGQPVTLVVLHDQEDVDENGIVQGKPWRDTDIELSVADGIEVIGESKTRTGLDGYARFTVRCTSTGKHDVTVATPELSTTVTLAECLPTDDGRVEDETTTTTTSPENADPSSSSTSTTIRPFPVGSVFTTPYRSEVPAGTYVVLNGGAACSTDYELYIFTGWSKSHANGSTIVVPYPARNFVNVSRSPSCTFRRTK